MKYWNEDNIWIPTTVTDRPERDMEIELDRRCQILKATSKSPALQQYELKRCKDDPLHFCGNYLWVSRPDLADQFGDEFPLPWLMWPVHKTIIKKFLGLDGWRTKTGRLRNMAVRKSRDTGISVGCLSGIGWSFCFRSSTYYLLSLKREAVDNARPNQYNTNLFGKLRFFIKHLPVWMRPESWLVEDEEEWKKPAGVDALCSLVNTKTGSTIIGSSTTGNATRSGRATRVLIDEADAIPCLDDILASALKVGPIALVSSVSDESTYFSQLTRGETGITINNERNCDGWIVDEIHYTQRPDWNPNSEMGRLRIAEMKSNFPPDKWQMEMEVKELKVSAGSIWGPYLDESLFIKTAAEDKKYLNQAYRAGEVYSIEAWDYGVGNSLTAWVLAYYIPSQNHIIFADYKMWSDIATCEIIVSDIEEKGWGPKSRPDRSICDKHGGTQTGARSVNGMAVENSKTWMKNMADVGIESEGITTKSAIKLREAVKKRLSAGTITFLSAASEKDPQNPKWPALTDAVKRYKLDVTKSPENASKVEYRVRKDINSHMADDVQYVVWAIDELKIFG